MRLGKLPAVSELLNDLPQLLIAQGFAPLPVTLVHGRHAGRYPMALGCNSIQLPVRADHHHAPVTSPGLLLEKAGGFGESHHRQVRPLRRRCEQPIEALLPLFQHRSREPVATGITWAALHRPDCRPHCQQRSPLGLRG